MIIEKWPPDRVIRLTMSMWFKSFLAFLTLFSQSEDGFSISSFSCWVRLFHESRTMEGVLSDRRWRPWTTSNGPTFDTVLIGPSCWYTDVLKIGYYVIHSITHLLYYGFLLRNYLGLHHYTWHSVSWNRQYAGSITQHFILRHFYYVTLYITSLLLCNFLYYVITIT